MQLQTYLIICLFSWGPKPSFFFFWVKENHSGSISVTILHNFRPLCPWASFGCFLFWTGDWPVLFFGTLLPPPPSGHRPSAAAALPPIYCLATLEKFLVGCNVLPMTAYGLGSSEVGQPKPKSESCSRRQRRRRRVSRVPPCAPPSSSQCQANAPHTM